jgi:Mg-chelatase subunit ChlD
MSNKIVFILDKSGSMSGLEKDVIGSFNSFLREQKKIKDEFYLTTVLFNTSYRVLHENMPIQKVQPLTERDYDTSGGTALLDAFGKAMQNTIDHSTPRDKVLFVINTDGEENSSKEYTNKQIKEMVDHYEKWHGWKFIFIGANMDAFAEGSKMGITYNFNYANTRDGIATAYTAVSDTTRSWRVSNGENIDIRSLTNMDSETKSNTSSNNP